MQVFKYLVLKALGHLLALVLVLAAVMWAPIPLVQIFDLNAIWVGKLMVWLLWSLDRASQTWTSVQQLLDLAWKVRDAVAQVYSSLVMLIHSIASLLPDPNGSRIEAATRAVLGEGWFLVIELSLALRIMWAFVWWRTHPRKATPQDAPQ